jgi:hypothetical protein
VDNPDMFLSAMQGMDGPVLGAFAVPRHLALGGQRLSTGGQLFDSPVEVPEICPMGIKTSTGSFANFLTYLYDLKQFFLLLDLPFLFVLQLCTACTLWTNQCATCAILLSKGPTASFPLRLFSE